jgi:hypothetical protein
MRPKFLSCNRSHRNFSIIVNLCNKYEGKFSRGARPEDTQKRAGRALLILKIDRRKVVSVMGSN